MKVWKKTIAISATALFATGVLAADNMKERMEQRFKELDRNGNGIITHAEMMANVQEKFAEFDKNRDGFLTLAELPKEMPVPEHVRERMEKRAERMQERMAERGEEFDPGDLPPPRGPRGGRFDGKPTRLHFVAKHDRDGDERVSVEEFAVKALRHFKRMDVNGDGEVTKSETIEAAKEHRMKRGKGHPMQPHHGR